MAIRRTIAEFSDDIATADIADDAITGGKLANNIAISTTGAIAGATLTTTGNITMADDTSIGIGDAAERIEFDGAGDISVLGANLGIGVSAPLAELHIQGTGVQEIRVESDDQNAMLTLDWDGVDDGIIKFNESGTEKGRLGMAGSDERMFFKTAGTERMTILSSGKVGIGTTAPVHLLQIEQTATTGMGLLVHRDLTSGSTDSPLVKIHQNHASDDQICFYVRQDCNQHAIKAFNPSNYNNTSNAFLHCGDNVASRCNIYWDGSIQNVNGTYGSGLSDERLKTNIEDVNSQWDDVKNINMVNFKLQTQGGENDFSRIGVIAQQVAGVSPNLVGERKPHPEDIRANSIFGTLYEEGDDIPKGKEIGEIKEVKENVLFFKDSIFFWKCAKALQEAMAKIETLQTKVTALEAIENDSSSSNAALEARIIALEAA